MFNLDIFMFASFLALNLGVGLWYSRGVKTLRQYAIGDKQFSTIVIALTIAATFATGSSLGQFGIYKRGAIAIIPRIRLPLSFGLIAWWCIRSGEFLNHLTIAEAMGSIYGKKVRIITAIGGVLAGISFVAIQFKAAGSALGHLFNTDSKFIVPAVACTIITYSALGGIKSVTFTDTLQFIAIGIFLPFLALKIYFNLKTPSSALLTISQIPNMSIGKLVSPPTNILKLIVMSSPFSSLLFISSPPIFQRMQMGRNVHQSKRAFLYAAIVSLLVSSIMVWFTLLIKVENQDISSKKALIEYLSQYATPGFKGIMAIGVMAMVMSTADSFLNATTVLVAHDLIRVSSFKNTKSMKIVRLISFIVGAISTYIALTNYNIYTILRWGKIFCLAVVTPSLVLSFFGFRSSSKAVLIGMVTGFSAALFPLAPIFKDIFSISFEQGMLVNLIFFLGSHYLLGEPGGWVGVKQPWPLVLESKISTLKRKNFYNNLNLKTLYKHLIANLPTNGEKYFMIGLYGFISNFLALHGLQKAVFNAPFMQAILYTLFLATGLLMTYPAWPNFMKKEKVTAWVYPLLLTYILFIATPIIVSLGQFKTPYLVLLVMHTIVSITLLPLGALISTMVLGTGCSISILKVIGNLPAISNISLEWSMVYIALIFLIGFAMLVRNQVNKHKLFTRDYYKKRLLRNQKETILKLKSSNERFVNRLSNGQYNRLNKVHALSKKLINKMEKEGVSSHCITEAQQIAYQIKTNATYIDQMVAQTENREHIHRQKIIIRDLLEIIKKRQAAEHSNIKLAIDNTYNQPSFYGDFEKVEDMLTASIDKIASSNKTPYIILSTTKTKIKYPHTMTSHDAIAFSFTNGIKESTIQTNYIYKDKPKRLLSSLCTMVDQHYGYLDNTTIENGILVLVLPQDIKDIKPNIKEEYPISLSNEIIMRAKKVEGNFWASLLTKPCSKKYNIARLTLALDTIKWLYSTQQRDSGDLYYTHPIHVAIEVAKYTDDEDTIIAALLHDGIEDTNQTMQEVEIAFGQKVRKIIYLLTDLETQFKKYKLEDKQKTILQLYLAKDPKSTLVKLCDRLDNLRTLGAKPPDKRIAKAKETLVSYVPLAIEAGFNDIADKLKKHCKTWLEEKTN